VATWWPRCSSAPCHHRGPGDHRGAIAYDGFSVFIQIVVAIAIGLTALIADGYLKRESRTVPSSTCWPCCPPPDHADGSANDLIVIFLGLEILSIAL